MLLLHSILKRAGIISITFYLCSCDNSSIRTMAILHDDTDHEVPAEMPNEFDGTLTTQPNKNLVEKPKPTLSTGLDPIPLNAVAESPLDPVIELSVVEQIYTGWGNGPEVPSASLVGNEIPVYETTPETSSVPSPALESDPLGPSENDSPPTPPNSTPAASVPTQHFIFYTSQIFSGNMGGLAGADALCQAAAQNGLLLGTWKAILSDESTDARARIQVQAPVKNIDGGRTLIAHDANAFWSVSHLNWVTVNEFGVSQSNRTYYMHSGSTNDGFRKVGATCNSWTNASSNLFQTFGGNLQHTAGWLDWLATNSSLDCSRLLPLYCISQ